MMIKSKKTLQQAQLDMNDWNLLFFSLNVFFLSNKKSFLQKVQSNCRVLWIPAIYPSIHVRLAWTATLLCTIRTTKLSNCKLFDMMVPGCSRTSFLCEMCARDPERNLLYLLTEDGGSQFCSKCDKVRLKWN